jgi:hypothetical protein
LSAAHLFWDQAQFDQRQLARGSRGRQKMVELVAGPEKVCRDSGAAEGDLKDLHVALAGDGGQVEVFGLASLIARAVDLEAGWAQARVGEAGDRRDRYAWAGLWHVAGGHLRSDRPARPV